MNRRLRHGMLPGVICRSTILCVAVLLCGREGWPEESSLKGADWELHALGVTTKARLAQLRALSGRRPVTLAIVGQGGVSKERLASVLVEGNTLEYCMWPDGQDPDPRKNTHDTGAARVILDLTLKLGVETQLLVYHAGKSWDTVAEALARAGREADVVTLYQSFWGNVSKMVESIRGANGALFISPYVEHRNLPTRTCLQAHSAKPWAEGIPHFVTAIPLARKAPGRLLTPSDRPGEDTEVVNLIAPSYYASGAGGTCPSAEVTGAVAAWIVAASEQKPTPVQMVEILRRASVIDREALTSLAEFGEEHMDSIAEQIARLREPPDGTRRKLDAGGIISLHAVYQYVAAQGGEGEEPGQ